MLALSFALSTTHVTYPIFDWLDTMRDKLSAPIMGKVVKAQDKSIPKPQVSKRHHTVKSQVAPAVEKTEPETSAPLILDIAEMFNSSVLH